MLSKKILTVATIASVLTLGSIGSAHAHSNSWNLSRDLLTNMSANPTVPASPATGVWSFMENKTGNLNPTISSSYTLLPSYGASCDSPIPDFKNSPMFTAVNCWQNKSTSLFLPIIGISPTATIKAGQFESIQGMTTLHPENGSQAVLSWKSPIKGKVNMLGGFAHINKCGDGVQWQIRKTKKAVGPSPMQNLTNWASLNQNAKTFSLSTSVDVGTEIYFVVDKKGEHSCDSTSLDVLIAADS